MNIAVCDDTVSDRDALCACIRDYCEKSCYEGKVSVFDTGEALLDAFSAGRFDLVFLDIYLPALSGIETAKKIREVDRDCMLVFITVSRDHTAEGFDLQASGYVIKPIDRIKMDKALHMCRGSFERNSRTINIPVSGGNLGVSIAGLVYVEIFNKDAVFHMIKGTLTSRIPLDELESLLGGKPFLHCHRSYIINMNYVEDMRDNDFLMRNGDIVPMRRNGRKEVRMAIAGFVASIP